ncbi:MAG: nucleoside hydrolase [Candidatus Nitrosocaldus sp.]
MQMKVLLDMDPGVDDAIALILALNNADIEIVALSTVSGNVSARTGAVNALRICNALDKSTKVIQGLSKKGYRRSSHAVEVHGMDGLGDSMIGAGGAVRLAMHSSSNPVGELASILASYRDKEVTLLCTAPLTNIAALLDEHSDVKRYIGKVYVMGGAYDLDAAEGNVTRYAEFNFYTDAVAADKVMGSDLSIVACGLELTSRNDCSVDHLMLKRIESIGSGSATLAARILKNPVSRHSCFNLHDVFALAALLEPEIFAMKRARVRVETTRKKKGMCITEYRDDGNISICYDVKADRFMDFILNGLR